MKDAFCTQEMPTRLMVSAIEKAKPQSLVEKYLWDLNKTSVLLVSVASKSLLLAPPAGVPLVEPIVRAKRG